MDCKTVLIVDDEVHILNSLKRLLRKEGYNLRTVTSGEEGVSYVEKNPVQLVISDYRMPGMTGTEFLQKVKGLCPDAIRVILSGYADVGAVLKAINEGEVFRFIMKPWNDEELKTSIRQCLVQFDLVQENRKLEAKVLVQRKVLQQYNEESLRLSGKVLMELPIPIIVVGKEGTVALINKSVRKVYPSLKKITLGTDMHKVFPDSVTERIKDCLKGVSKSKAQAVEFCGRRINLGVEPLEEGSPFKGCMIVLG